MKAILEFNLPEDADEWRIASDASRLAMAVSDIDNEMRAVVKYDHPPDTNLAVSQGDFVAVTDYWRRRIHEEMQSNGVRSE